MMKNRNYMDLLKKVDRVEAPPFLLTRIEAGIRAKEAERMPLTWTWAGSLVLALLLLLNGLALRQSTATIQAENLIQQFQMNQTNQLYGD